MWSQHKLPGRAAGRVAVLVWASHLLVLRCGGLPSRPHQRPPSRHYASSFPHSHGVLVQLRGGNEEEATTVAVSTMAVPGLNAQHAFAPLKEAASTRRKSRKDKKPVLRAQSMPSISTDISVLEQQSGAVGHGDMTEASVLVADAPGGVLRHDNTSQELLTGDDKYAWFYPDPPWGRKDGSRFLQKWDCVVWLAMLHVAFTVPIRAAGFLDAHVPNDDLSCQVWQGILRGAALPDLLDLFVDAIFICDMFVSMHTAFYRSTGNGHRVLVEEVGEVRQRYLRSRALLYDICGVVPLRLSFCVLASLLPSSIRPSQARFVKNLRVLRMAKLLRLHHVYRISNFINYSFPRHTRLFALVTLLLQMLFTGHLLACLWYWIGTYDPYGGWVGRQISPHQSALSRYISSFYFVYATITTVGYGDMAGINTWERLFCVGAMVLGGFLFGLLIGSVPKILDVRSEAGGRYLVIERRLKEYLRDKQVPPALQARILQFFEYRYPERRSFDGYKIIRDLPVSLQKDLAAHVHGGVVSSSPILRRCSPKTTGELCLLFRRVFAAEGDVISREGTQSTGLYFIVSGQVALSQGWECKQVLGPGGALDENAVVDGDGSGIVWYTATALEPTEMVVILRSDFEDLVAHRPDFIPTYNLDSWDSVKGRILQRRSHRLGIDSCQQVVSQMDKLRQVIRNMVVHQRDKLDQETKREAIKVGESYSGMSEESDASQTSTSQTSSSSNLGSSAGPSSSSPHGAVSQS